jgi:succinate-semialdehyde dehydrogenase / glutarate-semialdehyde dehydrogenase
MTISTSEHALAAAPTGLFMDGQFAPSASGTTFPVLDPATGEELVQIADAGTADALRALDLATAAQEAWGTAPPRERADVLRRAYELIIERSEDLALLMTLEMGKPIAESRAEVAYGADFLRWFAEEAVRIAGSTRVAPAGGARILTIRRPVGPCLLVTPWNFPLAMGTRKIGPALAAGCTVIVKPAALTPLTMNALASIMCEAGLPAGVLAVLPTSTSAPVVASVMTDPRLRKISFTGSTEVGRQLIAQAADGVLRVSMELGGNAPLIVCADADIPHAAGEAMKAKLRNNGEACTAANVFYVHEDVADAFADELTRRFDALRVGPGAEPETTVGPVIDARAVSSLSGLLDDAVERGARVLSRPAAPEGTTGTYFAPALLDHVPLDARVVREEIFGPIAPIVRWSDEAELLSHVNASEYGLAAYLFTRDLDRARRIAERLEHGMIGVNRGVLSDVAAPFGGVKQSGYGREGGDVGIDEYLQTTYISLDAPE